MTSIGGTARYARRFRHAGVPTSQRAGTRGRSRAAGRGRTRQGLAGAAARLAAAGAAAVLGIGVLPSPVSASTRKAPVARAALPPGKIDHIFVVDLENQGYSATFGASSPATYLNGTLRKQGLLVEHYYATGHVSMDNYIAQVSGQAPNHATQLDCLQSGYVAVTPGTDDPDPAKNPGQVDGTGCVYPAPSATAHGAPTIADQLDARYPPNPRTHVASWRAYVEDMGNVPARDGGVPDPTGGTDCAHPAVGGTDKAEAAVPTDQYVLRHDPFVHFSSIIDNRALCDANVVPMGTLGANGRPSPSGHLASDLRRAATTPKFAFLVPNVCDDGHDATCTGTNDAGGHTGGLVGADLWLAHWMPLVMSSPAYRDGSLLVVVTADEADVNPSDPTFAAACCNEQPGPNTAAPGDFGGTATTDTAPGGGQVGALLLDAKYVRHGALDSTGRYDHYSALRSYEDLLGLTTGGTDGLGHLGFAAAKGLVPFGRDVFGP